ncbi:MAG: hypothetical protein C0609_08630 [Deltaproteobacteria bacterium]|nr:MAG: hypothetical protein C0609_08630 [Deltaproteobacteria bacterium]
MLVIRLEILDIISPMKARCSYKAVELPAKRGEAAAILAKWKQEGALGGVTTWGSGIAHRDGLRLYWLGDKLPEELSGAAETLIEEDWTPHWQGALSRVRVSAGVTLTPAWLAEEGISQGVDIILDPGMAFGAGDHPTTRMCSRTLEQIAHGGFPDVSVLDVGAGTGVLSILAAKLGAKAVDALDIDPFCHASCERNIALNGVEDKVSPRLLSLDLLHGEYGLVIANIVAGQLAHLAPEIISHLAPGGKVLLSGFKEDKASEVAEYFYPLSERGRLIEEGWCALTMERMEKVKKEDV